MIKCLKHYHREDIEHGGIRSLYKEAGGWLLGEATEKMEGFGAQSPELTLDEASVLPYGNRGEKNLCRKRELKMQLWRYMATINLFTLLHEGGCGVIVQSLLVCETILCIHI